MNSFIKNLKTARASPEALQKNVDNGYISWAELEANPRTLKTTLLLRLIGAITIVLAFSIAANSLLNYFGFQKTYQITIRSTFSAIAEELGFKIESGLNLGLPLSSMNNIPHLLATTAQYHENVRFLVVESPEGERYFSSGNVLPDPLLNIGVAALEYDQESNLWFASTSGLTVIGYDLVNSYQKLAGRLLLGYDQSQVIDTLEKVKWSLVKESALVLALFMVLASVSLYLIVYKFRLKLFALERALRKIVNHPPSTAQLSQEMNNISASLLSSGKQEKL